MVVPSVITFLIAGGISAFAASASASALPANKASMAIRAAPTIVSVADGYAYIGCYTEGTGGLALTGPSEAPANAMTVEVCTAFCAQGGYPYAGLEYGQNSFCGYGLSNGSTNVRDNQCGLPCSGDNSEVCGGEGSLTVYESG